MHDSSDMGKVWSGIPADEDPGEIREQRQGAILRAVLNCVSKDGADGMTIRAVADEAGVSTGLVLYYYPTKEELISAAWTYALRGFVRRMEQLSGPVEGLQKIEAMYRVCFLDRDEEAPPWTFWLEYWAKAARVKELREYHSERSAGLRRTRAVHVVRAIEAKQIRSDLDAELVADLLQAVLYGLAVEVTLDSETISSPRAFQIAQFLISLLSENPRH